MHLYLLRLYPPQCYISAMDNRDSVKDAPVSGPADAVKTNVASGGTTYIKPERLMSLDVFRGLTIAGMILVNDPGTWSSIYAPLEHADWNGWTPTDLVFPFFLFIVGVSMVLSFQARQAR